MKELLIAAMMTIAPLSSWAANAPRVFLGAASGRVEVLLDGLEPWVEVKPGTEFSPGTKVRTSEGASAVIAFDNGTKLELGSLSTWTLEDSAPSKISVFLGIGKLTAWVKGLNGGRFQVRSQTAVASVRGTTFAMGVAKSGDTSVWLYSGSLALTDRFGNSTTISSGQRVLASPSKGLAAPKPLPPAATTPAEPTIAFKTVPPQQPGQGGHPPASGPPPPDAVLSGAMPPPPPPPSPTQNTATTCTNTVSPSAPCP